MKRNFLLFFVLIILSLTLAHSLGYVVNKIVNFTNGSTSVISVGPPVYFFEFMIGFGILYPILSTILFGIWGKGKKWIWAFVLCLPVFWIASRFGFLYVMFTLVFFILGFAIVIVINLSKPFFLKLY